MMIASAFGGGSFPAGADDMAIVSGKRPDYQLETCLPQGF